MAGSWIAPLLRVTWALVWILIRMLFVVVRPIMRLPSQLRWLQIALALAFVLAFFYRPAIAYYWFWGSVAVELTFLVGSLLFGRGESLRTWWRGR
ncbi:MAG: hypothetical protein R3B48_18925 [Kofleriaceae bacterium]